VLSRMHKQLSSSEQVLELRKPLQLNAWLSAPLAPPSFTHLLTQG
jgi:hypothetical protein